MIFDSITQKEPIEKGWSGDKKYCAVTADGTKYLLRVSPVKNYDRRKRTYEKMREIASLGVPVAEPAEFGLWDEGVYMLERFIDGADADSCRARLDAEKQYRYGLDAGRILAKLHTLPAPPDAAEWETRFNAKIDRKIAMYENCELKYDNGRLFLDYIAGHRHLLANRPQTYQHGDYHIGNMMVDRNGVLTVIDFDREDYGDPWEEFNRIVWSAQAAPAFACGMVDG